MDLTIKQVATITGIHPESVRRAAREGRLEGAYRCAGAWRVRREAFEAMRGGKAV